MSFSVDVVNLRLWIDVPLTEQLPKVSNRVVNYTKDIDNVSNRTDLYVLCIDFANRTECDGE